MLLKASLAALLLSSMPVLAETCATGTVAMGTAALVGAQCTPLPPQRSDVYAASPGFVLTVSSTVTLEIVSASTLLANGTVVLPAAPQDGQPLTLESPHGVTAISVQPSSGQSISGSTIVAFSPNIPYRLKFSATNNTWYPN